MSSQPNYISIIADGATNYNLANGVGAWQQLTIKRVNIVCDSSLGAITIALPRIQDLRGMLELCFVVDDIAGAAGTNNITINVGAGDKLNFNATSFVISANYGKVVITQSRNNQSASAGNWVATHPVVLSFGNLSPLFTTSLAGSPLLPTLSFTAVNQNANVVYAGPGSGGAAAPTFRALVVADMPAGFGLGTVTSFSAGNLSPLFTTNVSTATSTPALSFTLTGQEINLVYASPASGGAGVPSFRNLVAADIAGALGTQTSQFFAAQTNTTVLTNPALASRHMLVFVNGGVGLVAAIPGTTYTYAGSTITWTPALAAQDVLVYYSY